MSKNYKKKTDVLINLSNTRKQITLLRQQKAKEIYQISQIDQGLAIAERYLSENQNVSTPNISLCKLINSYSGSLTNLDKKSSEDIQIITAGSAIFSGVANHFSNSAVPNETTNAYVLEIEQIYEYKTDREFVYSELAKYNSVIADMFISSWQTLENPPVDVSRGPAFYMREVISHFLRYFAPDELVMTKEWYKPHDESTKFTIPQRIKYISEECIVHSTNFELVNNQLSQLNSLYKKLNSAHSGFPLNTNKIKIYLYQTQDAYKIILPEMKESLVQ